MKSQTLQQHQPVPRSSLTSATVERQEMQLTKLQAELEMVS